ncbi:MAG: O-antigen ligase family protein [Variibacter sp.]
MATLSRSDVVAAAPWRSTASDWLAAAAIFTLPWSTSATSILIVAWMVVVVPALDWQTARRHLTMPAVYLPVVLWLMACAGMLWADTSWATRLDGLRAFHKLLLIPLLMIQFSRSDNGLKVVGAFLLSSTLLLFYSWASLKWPSLIWGRMTATGRMPGVPIKDYIYQSLCFVLSVCVLVHLVISMERNRRYGFAFAACLLIALFLANMVYVATARTALIVLPVLLLLIGYQRIGWRGSAVLLTTAALLGGVAWTTSPYLRMRVHDLIQNTRNFHPTDDTSEAQRIEFWRKSITSIGKAPIFGHGTGYIRDAMAEARDGDKGAAAIVIDNPHNQTFAVGIQLGFVGIAILFAMWLAHAWLFVGSGWTSWLGFMVVLQNFVASLFNSHLSDFTAGWLYVLGVGILGGTVLRLRRAEAPRRQIANVRAPQELSHCNA